jgi:hypothetical protein
VFAPVQEAITSYVQHFRDFFETNPKKTFREWSRAVVAVNSKWATVSKDGLPRPALLSGALALSSLYQE